MTENTRQGNSIKNLNPHVNTDEKSPVFLSMVSIGSLAGACGFFYLQGGVCISRKKQ